MCYEMKGEGFPLVMIIGFGVNLDYWNTRMIEELSKNFKTVVFDNRGTGRTDVSDKEYTIKLFADDTAGLMNALGISKAHILGWSMGGMIAQELALNYPEKVAKLVLYSTSCGGAKSVPMSQEASGMFMRFFAGGMSAEEAARMVIRLNFTNDFIDNNPDFVNLMIERILRIPASRETLMRQMTAIRNFSAFDRLSGIKAPTLVLSGKRDIVIPPENGSILVKAIPNARLACLEKSAHALTEDMEEVIKVITEFLL
jgi:pimeloyl-ACP methyl ester carboxylesterase